jgi:peptidoglycan/LPS O-acetylase OafA/YrhL
VFTSPINDVWWTLPVELMFYLILPLLVWLRRRVGLILVMSLLASITVGWRWWVTHQHSGENMAAHLAILDSLPGTLFTFGAGFAIANIQVHLKPTHATRILWMSVAGFFAVQTVLVSNIEVYWQGGWLLRIWSSTLAMSLAGFVLAICLGAGGFLAKLCSSNTMVWLGELSFGIYLWHFPVMQLLNALYPQLALSEGGSVLALAITMSLTLGLAALSYYKLERPLMEARMATS